MRRLPGRPFKLVALAVALTLCLGAKPTTDHSVKLIGRFTGEVTIDGNLATDPAVDIVATGPGELLHLGNLAETQLRWTVKREVALGLLSGALDEAPLNTGDFLAVTEDGATVVGAFSGVVKRHGHFLFEVRGDFQITGGTDEFTGTTGSGVLKGVLDVRDASYVGQINGRAVLPPG